MYRDHILWVLWVVFIYKFHHVHCSPKSPISGLTCEVLLYIKHA